MYADSILKMLKDIRKTVRASSKLQAGPNPFAQFLEEVSEHGLLRFTLAPLRGLVHSAFAAPHIV